MDGTGTLEDQLEAVKVFQLSYHCTNDMFLYFSTHHKPVVAVRIPYLSYPVYWHVSYLDHYRSLSLQARADEIALKKDALRKIEEFGAQIEEALIFDNKYTEHTPVSLAQQWDQLGQMVMRMQHNLEQQIQAR